MKSISNLEGRLKSTPEKYSYANGQSRANLPPQGAPIFRPKLIISIRSSAFLEKTLKTRVQEELYAFG
jgi:hypothetical protein